MGAESERKDPFRPDYPFSLIPMRVMDCAGRSDVRMCCDSTQSPLGTAKRQNRTTTVIISWRRRRRRRRRRKGRRQRSVCVLKTRKKTRLPASACPDGLKITTQPRRNIVSDPPGRMRCSGRHQGGADGSHQSTNQNSFPPPPFPLPPVN